MEEGAYYVVASTVVLHLRLFIIELECWYYW
jgi:hypothetical protein